MAAPVFLLSPANCSGKRAGYLMRPGARFDLALKLRAGEATIGEVFGFMSGLYFRGKLAYVTAFADTGAHVIVPGAGLKPQHHRISLADLRRISRVPVDPANRRYRLPLERDAERLNEGLDRSATVVLLGSIATPKYLEPLRRIFSARLLVPREFIGRGDMSRGSLMLRCARERRELEYVPAPT